jgi:GTP cyclohydrolase I
VNYNVSHDQVDKLAFVAAIEIGLKYVTPKAYPIPRGGVPAAYAIGRHMSGLQIVDDPDTADIFIDDLIDSGATQQKWRKRYPQKDFYALVNKQRPEWASRWVIWPWEESAESSIEGNITRLLQFVGENPERGGLLETPHRVAKAWMEWCSGYNFKPEDVLKTFEDGADGVDEMVVVKDIPFYSHCEHHMAAIFGTATIAYVPDRKIVGLSKLSRLLDIYARRLQVQERLTNQIADALQDNLQPKGVGVVIKARHLCMESRGVNQQGHYTITSALRGVMRSIPEARAEFLDLAR